MPEKPSPPPFTPRAEGCVTLASASVKVDPVGSAAPADVRVEAGRYAYSRNRDWVKG